MPTQLELPLAVARPAARRPTGRRLPRIPTSSVWCQRWATGRRPAWRLAEPGQRFDASNYTVERINRATAKEFVISRHYSGSHVACRQSFGLYRGGALVGVASFCVTSREALLAAFPELEPGTEALEWGRLVVGDPEPGNVETWFGARCMEMLHRRGVAAVLSFADPVPRVDAAGRVIFPGHVGYLYQGANFLLAGRSEPRTQWQLPDGMYLNGVTMQKIRTQKSGSEAAERRLVETYGARPRRAGEQPAAWLRDAVRDDPAVGVTLVRHTGCHRYLKVLGPARHAHQVKINHALRPDWEVLDDAAALPPRPYPKLTSLVRAA